MEAEVKLDYLRQKMVQSQLRSRGIVDSRVLEAFGQVPRELFMPPERQHEAYEDRPVSIGFGQTISQPYIVALMAQELRVGPEHRVLDVGAGSGYQTAILAHLAGHVYALERIEGLTDRAMSALAATNVTNVTVITRDGSHGWPEEAPFDRIICGAAARDVPQAWVDQLRDGGRMLLPIGGPDTQMLVALDKIGPSLRRVDICTVRFVKLIGPSGWPEDAP